MGLIDVNRVFMSTDVEGDEQVQLGLVPGLLDRWASKPKLRRSAHFSLVSLKILAVMASPPVMELQGTFEVTF